MRVTVAGWLGAAALVAACSGASSPLGTKDGERVDAGTTRGGGSGGSSGSASGSGGASSSGSSGGVTSSTCVAGTECGDGTRMNVCTTVAVDGACQSITYSVAAAAFSCPGCTDCGPAQSQASDACSTAGGSSSGGSSGSKGGSGSGGSSGGTGSSGSSSGGKSGSGGSGGSSGGTGSSGSSSGGTTSATCQAEALDDCVACCQGLFVAGTNDYIADIQACTCGTSGACQTECGTEFCVNGGFIDTAGDACETCLDAALAADAGPCVSVGTECMANVDCLDYAECTNGCPAQ